jgi:hypothetical protein
MNNFMSFVCCFHIFGINSGSWTESRTEYANH